MLEALKGHSDPPGYRPADGTTVTQLPGAVVLTFSEAPLAIGGSATQSCPPNKSTAAMG